VRKGGAVLGLPESILKMKRVSCLNDESIGAAVVPRQSLQALHAEVTLTNEEIGSRGAVRNL
jgi:hypothetical protein